MPLHALIVAGAVSYDYLVYPMTAEPFVSVDTQHPANVTTILTATGKERPSRSDVPLQLVIRAGGADLVAQLLTAAAPQWNLEIFGPELPAGGSDVRQEDASSLVQLTHAASASQPAYRVLQKRQLDWHPSWQSPDTAAVSNCRDGTVVVCGSGEALEDPQPALDFLTSIKPRFIIHQMTRPLAVGPVWDLLRNGPLKADGSRDIDGLVVIIDADDLRAEGIPLSRSLSWEATAEDFVRNLGVNGKLDTLVTCANLIVRFGNEGIIHHRGRDAASPTLYFDPRKMECDSSIDSSQMIGLGSAFTAGFALGFGKTSPPDVEQGIRFGISASQVMSRQGFIANSKSRPDYPITGVAASMSGDKKFSVARIPSGRISSGDSWNIFQSVTGDQAELARQILVQGPAMALSRCPTQQFCDLLSVERHEQESLRAVVESVRERIDSTASQPTSIGILGPPGSGKKFVAFNLTKKFAEDRNVKQITRDARVLRLEDLTSICHTIRDHTATGALTVVCFENFEAILLQNNGLLNDFLAIMRDGTFADRGHVHALGHPLFFFLVNQELSALDARKPSLVEPNEVKSVDESVLLDYLHGLIRVTGPNQNGKDDAQFPIRRALMLRHMLLQKFPQLAINGKINIDEAVLHALLFVPSFKHGLRSLDKILSTSRLSSRTKFDVSALPPEEQIQLHVDGQKFMAFLRSPRLPHALRETLAKGLFEAYKKKRHEIARTEEEIAQLANDQAICDWDELSRELQESTRAQADDIPRKLRAVNCFMLNDLERGEPLVPVSEFTTEELDMLSEMEHERFNAERLQKQWHMGRRSASKRTTPFLVPWRELSQDWKDVDRVMVECSPHVLATAGWRIYRMQKDNES